MTTLSTTIHARTVFFDPSDGYVRMHDWASVTTDIGSMLEPFPTIGQRFGNAEIDWTDDMVKITTMANYSLDNFGRISDNTIGGTLMPRTGR